MSKTSYSLKAGRPSAGKKSLTLTEKATKRVNFNVTPDEHKNLKVYAAKNGKTVTELLKDYVRSLPED